MRQDETLVYSKKRLEQVVSLSPQGVSIPTLAKAFEILNDHGELLILHDLKSLEKRGKVRKHEKSGLYYAIKPMSDLVMARVSASLTDESNEIRLDIVNAPADFPFYATITRKKFQKFPDKLNSGDLVAVVLERHHGTNLRARFIEGTPDDKRNRRLSGHFTAKAQSKGFEVYEPGVETTFRAEGRVPLTTNSKVPFSVTVPEELNPFDPHLNIGEQKWDPTTGRPIAEVLAEKHHVQIRHSNAAVNESAAVIAMSQDLSAYRSLRGEHFFVIDPIDARDHDDAILVERTREGFRTMVAISDVARYVQAGSALDKNARARAFSFYLPDYHIPMLPQGLVEHASLSQGGEKPVVYCEQFWDEQLREIRAPIIGLGVIASQKQVTYGQFDAKIDSNDPEVWAYQEFGEILIEKMRFYDDAIKFDIGANNKHRSLFAEALVSGLMVEANAATAEFLEDHGIPFIGRTHNGMDNHYAFEETKETLESWGYDVPDTIDQMTARTLNDIVAEADRRHEKGRVEQFLKSNFLQQAVYSTLNHDHFCLNRTRYAHTTSPIRRYSDILAQRGVHSILGQPEFGLSEENIEDLAKIASELNFHQDTSRRISKDAERYYAIGNLYRLEGSMVRATLGRVDNFRAEFVLHNHQGLRTQVPLTDLPRNWKPSQRRNSLIFNGNVEVIAGSIVRMRLKDVQPHLAQWSFEDLEPGAMSSKTAASAPKPQEQQLRIA